MLFASSSDFFRVAASFWAVIRQCLAVLLIALLSPVFCGIALLIKLTSKGPVFFLQLRNGYKGQQFWIVKFRTFACQLDPVQSYRKEHLTVIGRFLRKFSLDELPQLYNVARGEMGFVGPRPHAIEIDRHYEPNIPDLHKRYEVLPGITGMAQLKGYRGYIDVDIMREKISFDLFYIHNQSMLLDISIVMATVFGGFWFDEKVK